MLRLMEAIQRLLPPKVPRYPWESDEGDGSDNPVSDTDPDIRAALSARSTSNVFSTVAMS